MIVASKHKLTKDGHDVGVLTVFFSGSGNAAEDHNIAGIRIGKITIGNIGKDESDIKTDPRVCTIEL